MAKQDIEPPINADLLTQVQEEYYAVVDGFITQDIANQLLVDANRLHSDGHFQQHYFQFGGALSKKPNVRCNDLGLDFFLQPQY